MPINVMDQSWPRMTAEMLLESCKYDDAGTDKHEFIEMLEAIHSIAD